MAHYLVEYKQVGSAVARNSVRPDHIAYRQGLGSRLILAGPLLGEDGEPEGSVVIIEAASQVEATAIAEADPFIAAGLFDLLSVRALRIAALNPPA